jgi:hypothetical protein
MYLQPDGRTKTKTEKLPITLSELQLLRKKLYLVDRWRSQRNSP